MRLAPPSGSQTHSLAGSSTYDFLQLKGGRGKISETFYRIIETKVQNTCLTVVGYIIQTLSKFGWRKETGLLGMVVKSGIFRRIVVRMIHLSSDLKKKT